MKPDTKKERKKITVLNKIGDNERLKPPTSRYMNTKTLLLLQLTHNDG
jgi:hypothetical protein